MDDIQGIADLTRRLASTYTKGKQMINASVTCFIPKAHTPFQNHAQMTLDETLEKLQYLKDNLRHPKVKLKWQDPKMSLLEGVWARGDRALSPLLVKAFELGCRLDGWSDHFDLSLWEQAFESTGIDPDFYTTRQRIPGEPLPWDHIDAGIKKEFLESELKKAEQIALTPDCRENACTGCGICNFKTIAPVVQKNSADLEPSSDKQPNKQTDGQTDRLPDDAFIKYELKFSKLEDARFFGHLEMATIFQRAVKRTGLAVKYSKGFNPSMRMSFATALPLGMESEEENLYIYLEKGLKPHKIMAALNAQLPQGIEIADCALFRKAPQSLAPRDTYQISFATPCIGQPELDRFLALPEFMVEDISKKGKIRKTDLRKALSSVRLISPICIEMTLTPYNARIVRPAELLGSGFGVDDTVLKDARIKKLKS
jgi:radical SAM-linked protein